MQLHISLPAPLYPCDIWNTIRPLLSALPFAFWFISLHWPRQLNWGLLCADFLLFQERSNRILHKGDRSALYCAKSVIGSEVLAAMEALWTNTSSSPLIRSSTKMAAREPDAPYSDRSSGNSVLLEHTLIARIQNTASLPKSDDGDPVFDSGCPTKQIDDRVYEQPHPIHRLIYSFVLFWCVAVDSHSTDWDSIKQLSVLFLLVRWVRKEENQAFLMNALFFQSTNAVIPRSLVLAMLNVFFEVAVRWNDSF